MLPTPRCCSRPRGDASHRAGRSRSVANAGLPTRVPLSAGSSRDDSVAAIDVTEQRALNRGVTARIRRRFLRLTIASTATPSGRGCSPQALDAIIHDPKPTWVAPTTPSPQIVGVTLMPPDACANSHSRRGTRRAPSRPVSIVVRCRTLVGDSALTTRDLVALCVIGLGPAHLPEPPVYPRPHETRKPSHRRAISVTDHQPPLPTSDIPPICCCVRARKSSSSSLEQLEEGHQQNNHRDRDANEDGNVESAATAAATGAPHRG